MEKKYTIEQIRTYLQNVDSLGDALYYLKDFENIITPKELEYDEDDIDYINLQE